MGKLKVTVFNEGGDNFLFDLHPMTVLKRPESIWNTGTYEITEFSSEYVLVIEKESVLFDLLQQGFLERFPKVTLITGKGYPDLSTKFLIKALNAKSPLIPIYYLGDADPHGVDIYLNYTYSTPLAYYENCNLPFMMHIGVDLCDLEHLQGSSLLQRLDPEDSSKAAAVLDRPYLTTTAPACPPVCQKLRSSLQHMLKHDCRCDIEAISAAGCLPQYIAAKIEQLRGRPAAQ